MSRLYIFTFIILSFSTCWFSLAAFGQNQSHYPPWFGIEESNVQNKKQDALPSVEHIDVIEDYAPIDKKEELSALEKMYANRLIDEPKQFGYDLFNQDNKQAPDAPHGRCAGRLRYQQW